MDHRNEPVSHFRLKLQELHVDLDRLQQALVLFCGDDEYIRLIEKARLADELAGAVRRLARCPRYWHASADDRTLRVDCSDDQCHNPEHTKYVVCEHPSHDAREALARYDALTSEAPNA